VLGAGGWLLACGGGCAQGRVSAGAAAARLITCWGRRLGGVQRCCGSVQVASRAGEAVSWGRIPHPAPKLRHFEPGVDRWSSRLAVEVVFFIWAR
jgi:hypothetical protein